MNEPSPASVPAYSDRSGWLVAFGLLHILVGALCGLLAPLLLLGQAMAPQLQARETNWRLALPSVATYLLLAVILIWLGVGSIRARRWARKLILVFAWAWLIFGVLTVAISALFLPQVFRSTMPEGSEALGSIVLSVTLAILSVLFVLFPAVIILFYHSPSVVATCEARDPAAGWTEGCPGEVLAVSLWTAVGGLSMLLVPVAYNGALPLFGKILSGMAGSLVSLTLAAVWVYAGWAMYRLQPIGWWVTFVSFGLGLVSTLVTFRRHELTELYRAMGFPTQQIQLMAEMGYSSDRLVLLLGAFGLPFMAYLIYFKKYFREPAPTA